MRTITYTDIGTNEITILTREEWKRRCADEFIKRVELDEEGAMAAADICLEVVENDPDTFEYDSPEDMANDEMDCWTDD